MTTFFRHTIAVLAVAATLMAVIIGCGGGGGGSSSGSLNLFVTDHFGDNYSQVWVTLYGIDLKADAATTFTNVYTSSAGQQINLADLASVAQLLNTVTVPTGTYTQAKITFGDHFTLVPKAGGAGQSVAVGAGVGVQSNGQVAVTIATTAKVTSAAIGNVTIDFNLASFQLVGGKCIPALNELAESDFHGKSKFGDIEGVLSSLTATSFTIVRGSHTFNIVTDANTSVISLNTGAAVALANGQKVEVKGTVDAATGVVTATTIKIDDRPAGSGGGDDGDHNGNTGGDGHSDHGRADIEGLIKSTNIASSYFEMTVASVEHITLPGSTVQVIYGPTTVFHKRGAATATIADVVAGVKVEVVGSFDTVTGKVTATRIEIGGSH